MLSMWTDDREVPEKDKFGGKLDPKRAPYYGFFKHFRRVVCDRPLPCSTSVFGPTWLYDMDMINMLPVHCNGTATYLMTYDDLSKPSIVNYTVGSADLSLYPVDQLQYLEGCGLGVNATGHNAVRALRAAGTVVQHTFTQFSWLLLGLCGCDLLCPIA